MTAPKQPLVPSSVVSGQSAELRAAATALEAGRAPARNPVSWFVRLVVEVVNKADRDRLLGLAAETAFFAVLTLFPALLVVAAVLGQLGTFIGQDNALRVETAVLDFLNDILTASASGAVETVRDLFDTGANALTVASLLAVASLSTAFATLINTVNIAYDVPETRGWWRRRWLALLLGVGTVITGAVAVTLLVIGPLFGRGQELVERVGLGAEYGFLWSHARWPVAFLSLVVWATTMDHFMPDRRVRWRYDLPGGLLTALLWLSASFGLSLYLEVVVTASPLFGALGGGLIVMTWFYLLCVALLAGAELNSILLARRRHRQGLDTADRDVQAELAGQGGAPRAEQGQEQGQDREPAPVPVAARTAALPDLTTGAAAGTPVAEDLTAEPALLHTSSRRRRPVAALRDARR